jgi:hypothetical protein
VTYGEIRFRLTKLLPAIDPDVLEGALNDCIQNILDEHPWKWLESSSQIVTNAVYQAGSVSLTFGSTAVTGSGTTFTTQMSGRRFRVSGRTESYTFTFIDPTHGTLDRAFEGDTGTVLGYSIYQNLYDLPSDYKQPRDTINERLPMQLDYVDRGVLDRSVPNRPAFGEPQLWCEADREANQVHRAELYPIPEFAASYPLNYLRQLARMSDADTGTALPDFISVSAYISGVQAMLAPMSERQMYKASYLGDISQMRRNDARVRGPQKIRIADAYTRHRLARATSGYPRRIC